MKNYEVRPEISGDQMTNNSFQVTTIYSFQVKYIHFFRYYINQPFSGRHIF